MRGIKKYLAGAVLSVSFLMAGAAQAMPIPQFDQMSNKEQGQYTVFLIQKAMDILKAQGDVADADKAWALFETNSGQAPTPASIQFARNLNGVRQLNQQNAGDPKFKPFEVEHAMSLTLKQNGIVVPVSQLLLASQSYKPAAAPGGLSAQQHNPPPAPAKP